MLMDWSYLLFFTYVDVLTITANQIFLTGLRLGVE